MGFGRGLLTRRRGDLVRPTDSTILTTRFALLSRFPDVEAKPPAKGLGPEWVAERRKAALRSMVPTVRATVVVPQGTPPPLPPNTTPEERAVALVAPRDRPRRSLIGDARDLCLDTFARVIAQHGGGREPPGASWSRANDDIDWRTRVARTDAYLHVGPTARARQLLEGSAPHFLDWDGRWESLDADGYVAIALRDPDVPHRKHLIVLGGSDYGTYFGVSWLLQRYCGARWLYPGDAGSVLLTGHAGECIVVGRLHRIEEPDFRSRTFTMAFPSHTRPEFDALRDWQLRNRLRPTFERQRILRSHAALTECGPTGDAATLALLRSEERIPADHNLATHLSPTRPMIGVGPALRQEEVHARVFPDVRVRGYASEVPAPTPPAWIDRGIHGVQPTVSITTRPAPTPSPAACAEQPFPLGSMAAPTVAQMGPSAGSGNDGIIAVVAKRFSRAMELTDPRGVASAVRQWRFIPRTRAQTLMGPGVVLDPQWVPCLYAFPEAYDDAHPRRLPVRDDLRATLAMEVALAMTSLAMYNLSSTAAPGEAAYSLAREDGVLWCQCHACTLADELGGPGTVEVFFLGLRVGHRDELTLAARRGDVTYRIPGLLSSAGLRPWFAPDATVASLCLRGVIIGERTHSNWRSRRVVDLMNAVATTLEGMRGGMGMLPADATPLLTFLAYIEGIAPPLFEAWPGVNDATVRDAPLSEPTRLHAMLLPWVVGACDEPEYAEDYPSALPADRRLAHSPQRFNQQRWSYLAAHTGVYEYLYGTGYLTPRIYSDRLRTGLRFSRTVKGCAFVAECGPVWGLEGPKLYEAARMLWDVEDEGARRDFCTALFGPAASDMLGVFTTLEQAWARGRERAQRVGLEARQGFGLTPFHQAGDILQFDYVDNPESEGAYNAPRAASVIDGVIARLDRTLSDFADTLTAEQWRQVRFYRDALGLTQLLAWLSRPARRVRQRMFDLSRSVVDPATPPSFNPLYGGATLTPTPDRSTAAAMRVFRTVDAAGQDPWPAFNTAIRAVPAVFLDADRFFGEVRGAVTRYLVGEAVRVAGGPALRAPGASLQVRAAGGVEQVDLIRTDGVWQRYGLQEFADYAAYLNDWVRVRGDRGMLADPNRGRGIEWFFVSLKNTLLIANECLEDRGRPIVPGTNLLDAPNLGVITEAIRYQRDA